MSVTVARLLLPATARSDEWKLKQAVRSLFTLGKDGVSPQVRKILDVTKDYEDAILTGLEVVSLHVERSQIRLRCRAEFLFKTSENDEPYFVESSRDFKGLVRGKFIELYPITTDKNASNLSSSSSLSYIRNGFRINN